MPMLLVFLFSTALQELGAPLPLSSLDPSLVGIEITGGWQALVGAQGQPDYLKARMGWNWCVADWCQIRRNLAQ
ncbi:hypothetical protein [Gimesia algae]|uniref:hypothetical protein n=1 Tax=Gimesia algae TaxID=2527971 RepID=UPI0018D7128F|nr:hypothetical protein [Gimesia algae]